LPDEVLDVSLVQLLGGIELGVRLPGRVTLSPVTREVQESSSRRASAMWLGWAQLRSRPSGLASAHSVATASPREVPSGRRPSVSTVKETLTSMPCAL